MTHTLPAVPMPTEAQLRRAYLRHWEPYRWPATFEAAMASYAWRICLGHLARKMLRQQHGMHAAGTPAPCPAPTEPRAARPTPRGPLHWCLRAKPAHAFDARKAAANDLED